MEESPLMLSAYRRNTKLRKLFVLVTILFAVSLVSTIVLAVLYSKEKTKNNNPPATPAPYDNTDDFPLYPPQPWNVSANHTNPLDFTTNQGTWMSIDVSKDGSTIVFDMLGDIYTLPIAGGAASPLRAGVPFETQPRYSPDGNFILFTSDISGCDNLWIMNLQTKEQYQVTNETYHFVSNGYWINDNTVVAVKWYTSTRSISAGEIWIYNVNTTGNALNNVGSRLVGRSAVGAQVGPEEPVPLTKNNQTSIFYSQNIMDGYTWNYNKDPHQVIYAIFQVDVASGASTTISAGAGGAARPIISHSGNLLAFIKRTVYNTSLIIHNLETGNEYILFGSLDFDQQESSAPAGVYPGYAFTPDDKAIIVWAQGNIYSIDTTTGAATQITYTVDVHLDLSPTVRYSHDADDGATFSTKIVTSPSISGDKKSFAFTSLATTYIYSNATGQITSLDPTPLGDGVFQFWPSISKDGAHLVQVVWNDQNLSTIEVVRLSDKTRYTLPTPKGRYAYPQFSPNGNQILFTRLYGDTLSGEAYTMNSGIYTATFSAVNDTVTFGTPVSLSSSSAWSPVFTSDGNSVLTQSGDYPVSVSEISTSQGSQFGSSATLASSLYATEIAVSPNKQFVAFIEFRKVYVAPYAQGEQGKPMNVTSLSSSATPNAQLCPSAGGQYLTWSYDSSTLYWVWGPIMYELVVPELKSCRGDCVSDKIKTYNLSVQVATEVVPDTQVVAFTNAVILTMENDEVITGGTIVVTGDVISALGPANETTIPPGATQYDLQGGFVMPGFIDTHAHWNGAWAAPFKVYADWEMFVNLAFGVTTMHNPSADSISVFQDAELIRAGRKVGPRIFSTGQIIYGAGGNAHCDIASSSDAEFYLLNLQAVGAWSAKSYNQPCRAARQRILDAARSLEMNVVPEGGMAYYWNLNQIIDGHTTIEHAIPMAPLYDDVTTLFARSGTAWTPTFIVNYGGIWGERYWFQHTEPWANQRLMMYAPQDIVQPTTMRFVGAQDADYHQFATSRAVAQVHQKGGIVEAGAHGEMQGIGIHWEMQMFSQSGLLSPYEILQTATINSAMALGLNGSIGSLKVGKLADLIFYNVTNDPRTLNTENVMWVMKNGHLYDAATMDQILPIPKTRAPLPQLNLFGPPGSSSLKKRRSHHPENH